MDIEELRKKEDLQMVEHLKCIADIISVKCGRCDTKYGCMGCVYSAGEMVYHLRECMWDVQKATAPEIGDQLEGYISKFNEVIGERPKVEPVKVENVNSKQSPTIKFLIFLVIVLVTALTLSLLKIF